MLAVATDFMQQRMHATVVINAYTQALDDLLTHMASISVPIDITNRDEMLKIIGSCIGTKIMNKWLVDLQVLRRSLTLTGPTLPAQSPSTPCRPLSLRRTDTRRSTSSNTLKLKRLEAIALFH